MQLNSCTNPIIYASTIPAFKRMARIIYKCGSDVELRGKSVRDIRNQRMKEIRALDLEANTKNFSFRRTISTISTRYSMRYSLKRTKVQKKDSLNNFQNLSLLIHCVSVSQNKIFD